MATPTKYQAVVTATNYALTAEDGTPFKPYLRFDGIDDWLQTNSIDFTSTDKMTVFAGVRKLSDAATAVLVELSSNSTTLNSAFAWFAPNTTNTYAFRSKGTLNAIYTTPAVYVSPISNVLYGQGNILTGALAVKIDGVQQVSATVNQGTGNYGNYPLYIGRRGGTTLPFNGQLYSLIVRGAQTSTTQIAQTERWVAGKTGVTL